MTDILERRRDAAQATLDYWAGKPFSWGVCDCSRIVAWHLRQLGYNAGLSRFGRYRTALGARAALRRGGHETIGDVLDGLLLARIAPAFALTGDIVLGAGTDSFGAFGIMLGNGAMLGFHEDAAGVSVLRRVQLETAWTVA